MMMMQVNGISCHHCMWVEKMSLLESISRKNAIFSKKLRYLSVFTADLTEKIVKTEKTEKFEFFLQK